MCLTIVSVLARRALLIVPLVSAGLTFREESGAQRVLLCTSKEFIRTSYIRQLLT